MAEFESLRLDVTLIDNASAGLEKLRQNLRALGGGESLDALKKTQREVERLTTQMGRVREDVGRTAQAAQFLGRTIGGAIATFATAFVSHFALDSLRRFTDEMVRLDGVAKQFGVGGAQIKSLVDQMKIMGIDAGAAQNAVTTFTTALADLSRQGSTIRQELMKGALSDPGAMQSFIARITGFASKGDLTSALNELVQAAESVFQAELARTGGNEVMAAELRNRFLKQFGVDDTTMAQIKGKFRELTEAEKAEYARRSAIAQSFSKEFNELDKKQTEFIRGLQEGVLPLIQSLNAAIGTMGEGWGKAIGDDVSLSLMKLIEEVKFLYNLVTNPIETIKGGIQAQAAQAHPTLQKLLGVETTPENEARWAEQRRQGNFTMWDLGRESEMSPEAMAKRGIEAVPVTPPPPRPARPAPTQQRRPHPGMPAAPPPGFQRMSFNPGAGQPIIVPQGSGDSYSRSSGGAQSQITRAVRTGVFEGLIDFRNFMQGGGTGDGTGGGFQRASLITGGPSGGGGYGGSTAGGSGGRGGADESDTAAPGGAGVPGGPPPPPPAEGEIGPAAALALAKSQLGDHEIADRSKLQQFFDSKGIKINPASTAWCAAFVNANLAAAGVAGTGSLAAASFTKWGQGVQSDTPVAAGDVGVVRGVSPRTGQEGRHVGQLTGATKIVNGVEMVEMVAGNEGNKVATTWRARSSLHVRRATDSMIARRDLDRDMANEVKSRTKSSGKLSVDVRAPPGTKVEASGDGAFSKTETNRSTPLPPSGGGGEQAMSI